VTDGQERDVLPDDEEEADWEWAREWARRSPAWSDEMWERINGGLGYRVRKRRAADKPLDK